MSRVINFSAGPAVLPEPVLRQAADEMLDWHGSGMSVMEMSHRGKEFIAIHAEAEALLRELLDVPADYKVLFLQGGAIARERDRADEPAARQVRRRLHPYRRMVEEVDHRGRASTRRSMSPPVPRPSGFTSVPPRDSWQLDPDAAYVHICANETIGGVEYHFTPDTGEVPLVADMSSNILSRPVDVSPLRPDLRRRAEEHRSGRADDRDRARGPDRPGAAVHAVGLRLQAAGRQRFDAEYAADLRDLHRRAGVQLDQVARRPGRHGARTTRAKAALLYDYLDQQRDVRAIRSRAPTAR